MSGLLWKDILVSRKNLKFYIYFLLAYFALAVLGIFEITFVTTFSTIILMMVPVSAFSFDEAAKWDRYARTLPLPPRVIAGARYLFTLVILLVVAAFSTVCAVLIDLLQLGDTPLIESIAAMLGSLGAGLFIVDVMLPLCFKLGPERARPYLFAVILIPFVAVFLLLGFGPDLGLSLEFLNQIPETSALGIIALIPLAGLAGPGALLPDLLPHCGPKGVLTMRLQGLLRWAGRGLAACSALLPFTGLIPPGGAAAWALLALSVPLLVAGEMAVREE